MTRGEAVPTDRGGRDVQRNMTGKQNMNRTVLVIEDDHLNMKLMRSLLGLGGYRMLEAAEAETGLRLAAEHRPDLILMDVHLPGLDGLTATRRLKQDPTLAAIPVIALTGLAMEGDREKALEAGCQDYITKPINTRSFLDSLGTMLVPQANTARAAPVSPAAANRPYSKILVVDDDPMNVKLVGAILSRDGYDCLNAYGGAEALALARQQAPDLIMLDIMMPEIDGYQVTRELKRDSATADIPVIVITALNGTEDKVRALDCGADEFLTKPVNAAELLARAKSMLRLKQYRDQLNLRTRSEKDFSREATPEALQPAARRRPHVLLVEDNEKDRVLFSGQIQDQDCDLSLAPDGEAGLQKVLAGGVDLVLLDIFLPGIDGFEVCQRIKAHRETRDVQVLLITCLNDLEGKIKGMELGADDYLVKPVDGRELGARVKALLAKKSYLDQLHAHYEHAVSSAISDGLTGLYNQTYFKKYLDLELKRSLRQHYPTSLVMLDLDDFKQLNDRFGHPAGDTVLKQIAGIIRASIREVDLAARYGGEEFAVVLPYADIAGARTVAERIRLAIHRHAFNDERNRSLGAVTASIGIAAAAQETADAATLIRQADQMLYRAKADGKNRIVTVD
jgi:two-component system cell cycle response regulator